MGKETAVSVPSLEPEGSARAHRERIMREMETLIAERRAVADGQRAAFFRPDVSSVSAYETSSAAYRRQLCAMLGWPLSPFAPPPGDAVAETTLVGEDDLGTISRVWIPTLPGVATYGLFFLPKGLGPFPLVICQHGGVGTPELCAGLWGSSANYNDMVLRVRRRGCAVLAPQLQLWDKRFEPDPQRELFNRSLVQVGGSIAALEILRLIRCIDYLVTLSQIDAAQIGMIGLSYGGFYTLFASAIETRIKAAVSSCFVNDRYCHNWHDWMWLGSAQQFLDAEVAQLICPRRLWIEVGQKDPMFPVAGATPVAAKIAETYAKLGIAERFVYREFEGEHELDRNDAGIEFLCAAIRGGS